MARERTVRELQILLGRGVISPEEYHAELRKVDEERSAEAEEAIERAQEILKKHAEGRSEVFEGKDARKVMEEMSARQGRTRTVKPR
ncbi:MAG: hypothetical protein KAY24_18275 [Candidatus Eisenbacteria sp.]|nr:hypothetical protein [Candidatus Eisenbacteria bacterium]